MLRLWGGGYYELPIFYELCDKYGLMIWHDFMFANTLYPTSQEFTDNVVEEVSEVVKRVRNHPSVVLWCGNNEILQGYNEWGWSGRPESTWNQYKNIFMKQIPFIIDSEDPDTSYIHSSPLGHQYGGTEGDVHYWAVWWGAAPIEAYENNVGLFTSEYGMQSLLPMSSMLKFLAPEDLGAYDSKVISYRNKMRGGTSIAYSYTK